MLAEDQSLEAFIDPCTPLPPTPMPKMKLKKYDLTEDELDIDIIDDAEMKMSNIGTLVEEVGLFAAKNSRLFGNRRIEIANRRGELLVP